MNRTVLIRQTQIDSPHSYIDLSNVLLPSFIPSELYLNYVKSVWDEEFKQGEYRFSPALRISGQGSLVALVKGLSL
jgi:hypothetical protein